MVNLIFFIKFLMTVVAETFLVGILFFQIRSGIMPICHMVNCPSFMDVGSAIGFARLGLPPAFISFFKYLLMSFIFCSIPLLAFFRISLKILLTCLLIIFAAVFLSFLLRFSMQSVKVRISISFIPGTDLGTLNRILILFFPLLAYALFALRCKAIFMALVRLKMVQGSREKSQTFTALLLGSVLGYSVHTLDLLCLASRQRMLAHRSGETFSPLCLKTHFSAILATRGVLCQN